jgi:hypothetical protein
MSNFHSIRRSIYFGGECLEFNCRRMFDVFMPLSVFLISFINDIRFLILLMEERRKRRPRIKIQFCNRISPSSQHKCNTYSSYLYLRFVLFMKRDICCIITYLVGIKYGGSLLVVSKF